MKIYFFVSIVSCFSSCRQDEYQNIIATAGEVDGMKITQHDTIIDAVYDGNWNEERYRIDLDNDGGFDLMFVSFEDTINSPGGMRQYLKISILNNLFSVAETPNTGNTYEKIDSNTFEYYGTFPRYTTHISRRCDSSENATLILAINSALFLNKGEYILQDFNWENYYGGVELVDNATEYAYWSFSVGGDTLIGEWYNFEESCSSAPQQKTFYIAFKKEFGNNIQYGWIELFIENNNRLTVSTSAITETI